MGKGAAFSSPMPARRESLGFEESGRGTERRRGAREGDRHLAPAGHGGGSPRKKGLGRKAGRRRAVIGRHRPPAKHKRWEPVGAEIYGRTPSGGER